MNMQQVSIRMSFLEKSIVRKIMVIPANATSKTVRVVKPKKSLCRKLDYNECSILELINKKMHRLSNNIDLKKTLVQGVKTTNVESVRRSPRPEEIATRSRKGLISMLQRTLITQISFFSLEIVPYQKYVIYLKMLFFNQLWSNIV